MRINVATAMLTTALSLGLGFTIMSCNNGVGDAPTTPTHSVKSPQALGGACNATISSSRCGLGLAALAYDGQTGSVTVSNSNDLSSGVSSTFAPAHIWQQAVDLSMPEEAGKQVTASAYDAGQLQSTLDITRPQQDPGSYDITPTFQAGVGTYNIEVYDNGRLVASQPGVTPGSGPTAAARCGFWRWVKFHVHLGPTKQATHQKGAQVNSVTVADAGACEWVLSNDLGAGTSITLPDGTVAQGNEIRFIESVDGGERYPYHSTDRVDVVTNIGSYTVLSEFVGA